MCSHRRGSPARSPRHLCSSPSITDGPASAISPTSRSPATAPGVRRRCESRGPGSARPQLTRLTADHRRLSRPPVFVLQAVQPKHAPLAAADRAAATSRRGRVRPGRNRERNSSARNPTAANRSAKAASVGACNRFRAAAGNAPAREVEPVEIAIFHAADGEVVGEVRREADGRAMPRDRFQPFRRPLHERLRRQQHARPRRIQRTERHADEAHVVIERQPAHGRIPRRCAAARPGR